ncbi:uncharacterized protein LOC117189709 isoform X2 [Drosophila miranda]|uniref:uncharacterized protein LOC117189709 isoform X2 n=1 Tax=Drosophila miranda TaxID=7229 RepID=UPI00143FA0CD|nr:uncharacterized protein LOC117189709 isoform X2 [Drosophila miranda]
MPKPKAKAKPKSKAAAAAASKREATKNNNAVSAEKENEMEISDPTSVPIREQCRGGAESMYTIMRHAELKESLHKRYEKELQQLYSRTYSSSPHVRYRICYFVNLIPEKLGPAWAATTSRCPTYCSVCGTWTRRCAAIRTSTCATIQCAPTGWRSA